MGLFYFGAVGHFRIGASIRIFFVDADEFDQALNAIVGERFDAMFSNAIDPDCQSALEWGSVAVLVQPRLFCAD